MLATTGDVVPDGRAWLHEVKWDGMRVLVEAGGDRTVVRSRNENDVSVSFPELQGLTGGRPALLDGEVVALGDGVPSFGALAERMHVRDAARALRLARSRPVTLIAFDLLDLDGTPLLARPLEERRTALADLDVDAAVCQVPPAYDDGRLLLQAAEAQGLEGVVSKRRDSAYHPGRRSRDWLKFPIRPTASYVVGGFRHETGSDTRLGSLLVGQPTTGGLVYRGKVGSGVAGRAGAVLAEVLRPLVRQASPFAEELPRPDRAGSVWVDPVVVVDVQYLALTREGRLRQPAYRGVRGDLSPADLMGPT
ncbi:MAG: non-homologous end-joining DNA ligase [Marmoricola sp.]